MAARGVRAFVGDRGLQNGKALLDALVDVRGADRGNRCQVLQLVLESADVLFELEDPSMRSLRAPTAFDRLDEMFDAAILVVDLGADFGAARVGTVRLLHAPGCGCPGVA